jgi:hypothetical protein
MATSFPFKDLAKNPLQDRVSSGEENCVVGLCAFGEDFYIAILHPFNYVVHRPPQGKGCDVEEQEGSHQT